MSPKHACVVVLWCLVPFLPISLTPNPHQELKRQLNILTRPRYGIIINIIIIINTCFGLLRTTTLNQNVKYSMFNLLQVHQAWRWKYRWATSSNLVCKQQHIKVSLKGGARCVIGKVRVFMWSFRLYMFVAGYVGKKLRTASAILFISIIPRIIISRPLPAKSSHRYCTLQFLDYEALYCTVNVTWSNIFVCPFERIQLLFWMKISRLRQPVTLRRSQSHLRLVCTLLNMHTMAMYPFWVLIWTWNQGGQLFV